MKKNLLFLSLFITTVFTTKAQLTLPLQTLFTQDFSAGTLAGATTTTTYPAVGDANKFDAILSATGSAAAGSVTSSVTGNKLRIARTAGTAASNTINGGATRATDIGAGDFMHYSFELSNVTYAGDTAMQLAYQFGIGTFTNAQTGYVANTAAFAKIILNFTGATNNFVISANAGVSTGNSFNTNTAPLTVDIYAYRNTTDTTITATYNSPGTTPVQTVLPANSFDVYVTQSGTTAKIINNRKAIANTPVAAMSHFKFSTSAVQFTGSVDIDNINVQSGGAVLPVNLLYFSGKNQSGNIVLNWATSSEQNNSHFNILRSSDGATFTPVAKITGSGTTSISHTYSFTDKLPAAGINYYQLQQVNYDGKKTLSPIIAVSVNPVKGNALQVYSSPSGNQVVLFYTASHSATGTVQVFDVAGRKLTEQSITINTGSNAIPVNVNLCTGLHILKLNFGSETISQKF